MQWVKKGRIFSADNQYEWMAHHASVPIADKVDDRVLRIYFGPRDRQGRTRPAFIDVEADNPANVIYVHDRPVLDLGKPGAFDDSGVMPSCIVNDGGRKYLYYIGWNLGVTVPYRVVDRPRREQRWRHYLRSALRGPDRGPHRDMNRTSVLSPVRAGRRRDVEALVRVDHRIRRGQRETGTAVSNQIRRFPRRHRLAEAG